MMYQPLCDDANLVFVLPVSYCDASFMLMMLCFQPHAEDSQPSVDVDDAPTFML
jgi:hypothetical protein